MKKFTILATVVVMLAIGVTAYAADQEVRNNRNNQRNNQNHQKDNQSDRGSKGPKLQWEKQLAAKMCNAQTEPIINVRQKIINDVDSGTAGNYWAFDTIHRQIKVWPAGPGKYCATIRYEDSKFQAVAGQRSPGNGGVLTGKERGEFEGGYRGIITGSLLAQPKWRLHGNVGTTDYACNISGNCPGYVSWLGQYFTPGYSFSYDFWGWVYDGGKYGIWINACGADIPTNPACIGNSGDIL